MTSPFGPDRDDVPAEELADELGEGEPDDTSDDDAGAGGEEPAAR